MPNSDRQSVGDLEQRQISAFEEAVGAPDTLIALRNMPVAGCALRNPQYLAALKNCEPTGEIQPSRDQNGRFWRQWECDENNETVEQDFRGATVGTSYVFRKQWLVEINIDLTYPILIGGNDG